MEEEEHMRMCRIVSVLYESVCESRKLGATRHTLGTTIHTNQGCVLSPKLSTFADRFVK